MFVLVAACAIATAACRKAPPSASIVDSLRCGMTPAEVSRLATRRGYNSSDPSWLTRSAKRKPETEKELLDFTFRDGGLAAVRVGTYDPRSRRVTYRTVDLCGSR